MTIKEKYQQRYIDGGCTIEQLQKLVNLKVLTQEEYNEIINIEVKH